MPGIVNASCSVRTAVPPLFEKGGTAILTDEGCSKNARHQHGTISHFDTKKHKTATSSLPHNGCPSSAIGIQNIAHARSPARPYDAGEPPEQPP
mmetsp:Transcript_14310/g.36546  ORF Transcript_14310/g.36546 Transcript_14310/m.36546 type:complete len:94 (-) Transcript_14310:53-334(-)